MNALMGDQRKTARRARPERRGWVWKRALRGSFRACPLLTGAAGSGAAWRLLLLLDVDSYTTRHHTLASHKP